jgi:hypothetical protein
MDPVAELLNRIAASRTWPGQRLERVWRHVRTMRAFLESDRDSLAAIAEWSDSERPYKIDPLGWRIAVSWADYLYGDEPRIAPQGDASSPAVKSDGDLLDALVEGEFLTELHWGVQRAVGEGESWWRIFTDEEVSEVPLVEWHSRLDVIPLFVGRRLLAAALLTELEDPRGGAGGRRGTVWRHLEVHADGLVEHVLYRGTPQRLGDVVPMSTHEETAPIADALGERGGRTVWAHGLPMLMGRIVNRRGHRHSLGQSDYHHITDFLLDLHEALVIGGENMRLTAKKRAVVSEDAVTPNPNPLVGAGPEDLVDDGQGGLVPTPRHAARFNGGSDLLVVSQADRELGRDPASIFKVLEYSYDADALIAHKRDLVESAVTRIGMTPQWLGVAADQSDGFAVSGTALRLRLIPTTKGGQGKARSWDRAVPRILGLLQRVDALSVDDGGFGRPWAAAEVDPVLEREDPIPPDPVEDAQVESTLTAAGVRSKRTSVKSQHPDWDDEKVDEELKAIDGDKPPAPTIPGFPPGA